MRIKIIYLTYNTFYLIFVSEKRRTFYKPFKTIEL